LAKKGCAPFGYMIKQNLNVLPLSGRFRADASGKMSINFSSTYQTKFMEKITIHKQTPYVKCLSCLAENTENKRLALQKNQSVRR